MARPACAVCSRRVAVYDLVGSHLCIARCSCSSSVYTNLRLRFRASVVTYTSNLGRPRHTVGERVHVRHGGQRIGVAPNCTTTGTHTHPRALNTNKPDTSSPAASNRQNNRHLQEKQRWRCTTLCGGPQSSPNARRGDKHDVVERERQLGHDAAAPRSSAAALGGCSCRRRLARWRCRRRTSAPRRDCTRRRGRCRSR